MPLTFNLDPRGGNRPWLWTINPSGAEEKTPARCSCLNREVISALFLGLSNSFRVRRSARSDRLRELFPECIQTHDGRQANGSLATIGRDLVLDRRSAFDQGG